MYGTETRSATPDVPDNVSEGGSLVESREMREKKVRFLLSDLLLCGFCGNSFRNSCTPFRCFRMMLLTRAFKTISRPADEIVQHSEETRFFRL